MMKNTRDHANTKICTYKVKILHVCAQVANHEHFIMHGAIFYRGKMRKAVMKQVEARHTHTRPRGSLVSDPASRDPLGGATIKDASQQTEGRATAQVPAVKYPALLPAPPPAPPGKKP